MKVFISSVRRGLERERDSLPGLIRALGHEPRRFEDFTAQSVPSREACLQGVDDSDVYLLLIGPHYGKTFPEIGRSATHEEYTAALTKGIPRLVFRKEGIDLDERQAAFVEEVEAYGTGVFRETFTDAADLQTKVAEALRDVPSGSLTWHPLQEPVVVSWRSEWSSSSRQRPSRAELDVHAVPAEPVHLSRRRLAELSDQIAGRLRELGLVPASAGIDTERDEVSASVALPAADRGGGHNQADHGRLLGARIDARGQRSTWERLPSDSMGTILDPEDLTDRIARSLRLMGAIAEPDHDQYAFAVELVSTSMTIVGNVGQLGQRTSASGLSTSDLTVRIEPDETVTLAAFGTGAEEVAATLADHAIDAFSQRR